MSTTAFQQISTTQLLSESSVDVDYLASEFLQLERHASQAYDAAYMLDLPHEHLKDKLVLLVRRFGLKDGDWKVLRGSQHELRLRLVDSSSMNTQAICDFRYALIKDERARARGLLPEIFKGSMTYTFREDAGKIISKLKLTDSLLTLYRLCTRDTQTPILEVRSI